MKTTNKISKWCKHTLMLLPAVALLAVACEKEKEDTPNPFAGADNHITSFVLTKGDVSYTAAIAAGTITVTVPENVSLNGATAEYTLCENAKILPDPATITDWESELQFRVTAYNGVQADYIYTVQHSGIIHTGAVILKTQAEVNAFGQGSYTIVDGALIIGRTSGTDTITSLAPLANLKIVSSIVINATYKGDLTAFEQLETAGEVVVLSKNVKTVRFPKLTTVRMNMSFDQYSTSTSAITKSIIDTLDFPKLTVIERGLQIYYADSLVAMNFPELQRVGEGIIMEGKSQGEILKLKSIDFPKMTTVGGAISLTRVSGIQSFLADELETAGGLSVNSCPALTDISIPALTTVNGNLSMPLSTTDGEFIFTALTTVNGDLNLTTTTVTDLQFPVLTTVEGTLQLSGQYLTSLELPSLRKVGTFVAADLRGITAIDVRGIEEIGALRLSNNTLRYTAGITLIGNETFPGRLVLELPNLGTSVLNEFPLTVEGIKVLGGLEHTPASAVATVKAISFSWLERITGLLSIGNSSQLVSISLPNLQSVGGISLGNLAALTTLDLSKLETITGYTDASGVASGGFTYPPSTAIITLTLPELKSVVGNISITGLLSSRKLATISFPKLKSLTGTLTITGTSNTIFTNLSGFSALTSAAGVTISGFTQLSDFSPLAGVVCGLTADTWNITNCGGTPADYSYDTMQNTYCNND
jgi:hypothetical protein